MKQAREIRGASLPVLMNSADAISPYKTEFEEKLNAVGGGIVLFKGVQLKEYLDAIAQLIGPASAGSLATAASKTVAPDFKK